MANKIQNPNLKINDRVVSNKKVNSIISTITVILMADKPNINSTNSDSNNAPNSNIKIPYKKCKAGTLRFAFYLLIRSLVYPNL